MGAYKKAIITDKGKELIARAVAEKVALQFSKAVTSSYAYPEMTDFSKLTVLQDERQIVVPSSAQVTESKLISIRVLFGNEDIVVKYLIQNIGLYVTDGKEEVLFSISQAITADEMPEYNGVAPSSFIYNIQLAIDEAEHITISINPAGVATNQEIIELQESINKLQHTITVNLPVANWSAGSPYTQSIRVEGVTEDMVLDGCLYIPKGTTAEQEKALVKAAACVSYFDTGSGDVTVTCIGKKPNADFTLMLKGV